MISSVLNSRVTLRMYSVARKVKDNLCQCRVPLFRTTSPAIRTGSTRFLERRVRREVARPAFPELMEDSSPGSMLRDRIGLCLQHGLLFTREPFECPSPCLKNRFRTNSDSNSLFCSRCFRLATTQLYCFPDLFDTPAESFGETLLHHFYFGRIENFLYGRADVPDQSVNTHQG